MQHGGLLVGVLGCFLVPACVRHPMWVVGVGCVIGVGHRKVIRADTLSGSRSTPCERPPRVVVVARAASQLVVGVGVCGGLL